MKNKLQKAFFMALIIALGITLVTFIHGEDFSLFKTSLYAIIAFMVDIIFSMIFDKKDN